MSTAIGSCHQLSSIGHPGARVTQAKQRWASRPVSQKTNTPVYNGNTPLLSLDKRLISNSSLHGNRYYHHISLKVDKTVWVIWYACKYLHLNAGTRTSIHAYGSHACTQ